MKKLLTVTPPFDFTGFGGRKLGVISRPLSSGKAPALRRGLLLRW